MTLDGTNTWVLGDPDRGPVVVVDPGPIIEAHLERLLDASAGGIAAIVLTHRHVDHSRGGGRAGPAGRVRRTGGGPGLAGRSRRAARR